MSDFLRPRGLYPTRLLCPWDSPGKNTGVGYHFLLQGIFLTQGWNPGLLHCRHVLYSLKHGGTLRASSSDGKESASSVGNLGSIPASGRFPREGNGNPLQYSCPENTMDRGTWWATVHGVAGLDMTQWLTLSLSYICIFTFSKLLIEHKEKDAT